MQLRLSLETLPTTRQSFSIFSNEHGLIRNLAESSRYKSFPIKGTESSPVKLTIVDGEISNSNVPHLFCKYKFCFVLDSDFKIQNGRFDRINIYRRSGKIMVNVWSQWFGLDSSVSFK